MLAWGAKVSPAFRSTVAAICARVGIPDPSWLMACIWFESNGNPKARNPISGATGLIQFMPGTARGLGTTIEAIAQMSAEEQLDLVLRYFLPYAGKLKTFADTYMAILYPDAIGHPDSAVIFGPESKAYLQNRGLDINHDGAVTKAEAASFPAKRLAEGLQPGNAADLDTQPAAPIDERSTQAKPEDKPMFAAALLPMLPGLFQTVVDLFKPHAAAAIAKATDQSPEVAAQFYQTMGDELAKAIGGSIQTKTDLVQAVAKITDPNAEATAKAALIQQLEDRALQRLHELGPLLDQMGELDKARWTQDVASADAAGVRGRLDRKDIAPQLVSDSKWAMLAVTILTGLGLAVQMYFSDDHKPDSGLSALFAVLVYAVARTFERPYTYRFSQPAASDAAPVIADTIRTNNPKGQA